MTRNTIKGVEYLLFSAIGGLLLSGCSLVGLDAQDSYDYKKQTLDPHINITARKFLETRSDGSATAPTDTVFRWMKKGLEYAGIDLAEFEKPGRTFIFLHNEAIRRRSGTAPAVTGGLFFDFPIVLENPDGTPQRDPVTNAIKTRPATQWTDYKKETVKKYFLYLIGEGEYNFDQLNAENKVIQSLLPPGSSPDPDEKSVLRYGFTANNNKAFDQAGKFTLKIQNNSDLGPIIINDGPSARTAGYIATNGIIHVYGATVYPYRPGVQ